MLPTTKTSRAERMITAQNARFSEVIVTYRAQKWILREVNNDFLMAWWFHFKVALAKIKCIRCIYNSLYRGRLPRKVDNYGSLKNVAVGGDS